MKDAFNNFLKGAAGISGIELLDTINSYGVFMTYTKDILQIGLGLLTAISIIISIRKNLKAPNAK